MENQHPFTRVGQQAFRVATITGEIFIFLIKAISRSIFSTVIIQQIIRQIYFIGVRSLPLVTISGFAIGVVMAMQTIGLLTRFGATTYVAVVVGLSMVKELGPVITALMVAGRAGSGMSAEIGSMKVTNQIDALKVLAVDPVQYLVTTRIVATVVVLPILTAIADVVGIGGGMLMGVTQGGIGTRLYIETTFRFIKLEDILSGLSKTIIFGLLIALIATYEGFKTKGGTAGVGLATTSTMVLSSLLIFISDVFLTKLMLIIF